MHDNIFLIVAIILVFTIVTVICIVMICRHHKRTRFLPGEYSKCPPNYMLGINDHHISYRDKILIVTYDDRYADYHIYSESLNRKYCQKFNISYKDYSSIKKYNHLPPFWRKVFIVRDALHDYPKFDYVMWMDKDACFTKHDIDIRTFLMSKHRNICIASINPYDEYDKPNAGVFIVRNTPEGKKFVNEWISHFHKEDWCKEEDPNCNLPHTVVNGWRTSSEWAGESYEQGSMGKLFDKYGGRNSGETPAVQLLPTCVLANCSGDKNDYVLVTHLMGYDNDSRLDIFKDVDKDILPS